MNLKEARNDLAEFEAYIESHWVTMIQPMNVEFAKIRRARILAKIEAQKAIVFVR